MRERRGTTDERRGFTIIELLIVIAMVAVLASVSLGRTSRLITGWRVNRAAQALSEEFQLGFALVGRNRKPVIMEFRTDSMNFTIRSRPDASGAVTVFRRRNFGMDSEYKLSASDLSFSTPASSLPSASLEVYPPGLAADSLSVIINKLGTARRVRLLRGGLTQICSTGLATTC